MKKLRLLLATSIVSLLGSVAVAASPQIITSGHNNENISIIDINSNKIVWQYPLKKKVEQCNSLFLMDGGKNVIFSTQSGAKIVSIAEKKVLWEYVVETPAKNELHSVATIPGGGFALFISGAPAKVIEYSADYKRVGEFEFDAGGTNKHAQFRRAFVNKAGNYQISLMQKSAIYEINRKGKVVAKHKTGYKAFSSSELSNDNIIFGIGDGHAIVEYNPATKSEVRKITKLKGEDVTLLYMAQVSEIAKGKYLVANWSGHNGKKPIPSPAPQLIIFNDDEQVEWMWSDSEDNKLGMIAAFEYSKKPIFKVKRVIILRRVYIYK